MSSGTRGFCNFHGNNILPQARRHRCGSVSRSQASSRRGWEPLSGNERTMRSAITLGLGIWMAAAAPGLRAQANASTPNKVKSALGGTSTPAQQAAQPASPAAPKPAPQTAKPAGKPTGKTAAKKAGKPPAKSAVKAVQKPATPGGKPTAAESEGKQARTEPFESMIGRNKKAQMEL